MEGSATKIYVHGAAGDVTGSARGKNVAGLIEWAR
jgi:hypothetical protein